MARVLILGCGPAGLAAASAVVSSGSEAVIVSKTNEPSKQYGCQYLHAPIPGYEDVPKVRVSYRLIGTPEEYRLKVYGSLWSGKVSPEDFIGDHDAWDIRETYSRMWERLILSGQVQIVIQDVKDGYLPPFHRTYKPQHIISSIPAPALCYQNHPFNSHSVWANGSTISEPAKPSEIICDGTDQHDWYRISNVFGYRTAEWPWRPLERVRPDSEERIPAVCVRKPLSTTCDCHEGVVRVGRYGTWNKKYLVHEVYDQVMEAIS